MKSFYGNKNVARAYQAFAKVIADERAAGRYPVTYAVLYTVFRRDSLLDVVTAEIGCRCADCRSAVANVAKINATEIEAADQSTVVH